MLNKEVEKPVRHVFDERDEAQDVLDILQLKAEEMDTASIDDLTEAVGEDAFHSGNQFGWTFEDLKEAYIDETHGSAVLVLPPLRAF